MQHSSNSSELEGRDSFEPMFPPSTKLKGPDGPASTVSVDADTTKEPEVKLTRMERFMVGVKFIRPLATMLFFDVGIPLAIYYILKIWLSVVIALVLSGIPPLIRVIYVFWKTRKVEVLGCIIIVSFVLSAVLTLISGK